MLELGRTPPATTAKEVTTKVAIAKLTAHERDESVRIGDDDLTTLHKGFSAFGARAPGRARGAELHAVLQLIDTAVRCGPLRKGTWAGRCCAKDHDKPTEGP